MLRRALASTRYIVLIAVIGTLIGAVALFSYQLLVVGTALVKLVGAGTVSTAAAKALAVGLIETVDVFLIAIVAYITSLGFYALFIDDKLPLPRWLAIHDLEDLKSHLVSVVIAVLAVLFLREAVAWEGERDLLSLGAAIGIVIAVLTFFLMFSKKREPKE